ncbi:class A beta-lactamase [Roseibium sp. RKSG952]|uniref:class A beta-lactamase n=1 Tax=Roseibium sp. RKSG952 TaxID=2529384 RepID=UPI0018AD2A54
MFLLKASSRGARAASLALFLTTLPLAAPAKAFEPEPLASAITNMEQREGARIGVSVLDTQSGDVFNHRGDERFPLNSTFKAFACGALLQKAQNGGIDLDARRPVSEQEVVSWSPVTEKQIGAPGLTFREHCKASLEWSDNTAANVVLEAVGGPKAMTQVLRTFGDTTTRIDRFEPDANIQPEGEVRDTTTPKAALQSFKTFVADGVLSGGVHADYLDWMKSGQVTGALLRPHLPEAWEIADRSGAGRDKTRSVIAAIWPPESAPVYVAIYIDLEAGASMQRRNEMIAELAQTLFQGLKTP